MLHKLKFDDDSERKRLTKLYFTLKTGPLEEYKYLSDDNFSHLYDVVVEFWTGNDDPPKFHEAKLCISEKKRRSPLA